MMLNDKVAIPDHVAKQVASNGVFIARKDILYGVWQAIYTYRSYYYLIESVTVGDMTSTVGWLITDNYIARLVLGDKS
jgi:hypothetical protein